MGRAAGAQRQALRVWKHGGLRRWSRCRRPAAGFAALDGQAHASQRSRCSSHGSRLDLAVANQSDAPTACVASNPSCRAAGAQRQALQGRSGAGRPIQSRRRRPAKADLGVAGQAVLPSLQSLPLGSSALPTRSRRAVGAQRQALQVQSQRSPAAGVAGHGAGTSPASPGQVALQEPSGRRCRLRGDPPPAGSRDGRAAGAQRQALQALGFNMSRCRSPAAGVAGWSVALLFDVTLLSRCRAPAGDTGPSSATGFFST